MATKLFGPCTFFDSSKSTGPDNQVSRADAARSAASKVNDRANSGEINEGADGELLSLYSSLSDFKPDEYFAKGAVSSAIDNFQSRRAVSKQARELGLNGATAAKDFQNKDELEAALKVQKAPILKVEAA